MKNTLLSIMALHGSSRVGTTTRTMQSSSSTYTLTLITIATILLFVLLVPSTIFINAFQINSLKNNGNLKALHLLSTTDSHIPEIEHGTTNKSRNTKSCQEEQTTSNSSNNSSSTTMILPIFPLRKRVKFPTESIQLTLWEERYKSLAQSVLNQSRNRNQHVGSNINSSDSTNCSRNDQFHTFGIVYASHKPQIIKDGNEPITPLIECGDVGVLCVVKEYVLYANNIPKVGVDNFPRTFQSSSSSSNDDWDCHDHPVVKDTADWNKIRLVGLGIERFVIEEIIQNGYQNDQGTTEKSSFILVKGSKICDTKDTNLNDNERLNKILQQKDFIDNKLLGRTRDNDEGLKYLMKDLEEFQDIKMKEYLHSTSGDDDDDNDNNGIEKTSQCKDIWKSLEDWSFAILSTFEANRPAADMLKMLSCTSLEERLEYIASIV